MMAQTRHDGGQGSSPVEGMLPGLHRSPAPWHGSTRRRSRRRPDGKVVLVDFWTYSCINCLRAIPYVRAWAEKYKDQGLVVIGVHAPEFAFERKRRQRQEGGRRSEDRLSRSPSTTTTRSGAPSTTSTGRRTTSSMPRAASATTISAKAATRSPSASSSSCWPRPAGHRAAGSSSIDSDGRAGRRRQGQRALARDLCRLCARGELRLARRRGEGRSARLCRRRRPAPQRMGARAATGRSAASTPRSTSRTAASSTASTRATCISCSARRPTASRCASA